MPRFYYFTRPSLASKLILEGIPIQPMGNIYDPSRKAWKAELNPQLCRIVREYFAENNLAIPQVILDAEKQY